MPKTRAPNGQRFGRRWATAASRNSAPAAKAENSGSARNSGSPQIEGQDPDPHAVPRQSINQIKQPRPDQFDLHGPKRIVEKRIAVPEDQKTAVECGAAKSRQISAIDIVQPAIAGLCQAQLPDDVRKDPQQQPAQQGAGQNRHGQPAITLTEVEHHR